MTELEVSLPNEYTGLVETPQASIDMEALAEKIVDLLKRELEREAERSGKFGPGR